MRLLTRQVRLCIRGWEENTETKVRELQLKLSDTPLYDMRELPMFIKPSVFSQRVIGDTQS